MRGWAVSCWAPMVMVAERRGRRTLITLLMPSPARAWASRETARAANTMVRWAWMLSSRPDAEDLVAHTLEIAWRRTDDVPADDPMPWLYAVAVTCGATTAASSGGGTICWRGSVRTRRPVPSRPH